MGILKKLFSLRKTDQKKHFILKIFGFKFSFRRPISVVFKEVMQAQIVAAEYLRNKYIIPYINNDLKHWDIKPKKIFDNPKIIWQYWGQGVTDVTPEIVRACINSVDKYKGDYKVIVLTNETIKDYIDLPDFVYNKLDENPEFTYTFFSDLLRVILLSVYGGIWIDATILLTEDIDVNILNDDFFMYQRGEKPKDYKVWEKLDICYFCFQKYFNVKSLSSFMIAKKNYPIVNALKDILLTYWENEDKLLHYFVLQIVFNELMKVEEYNQYNCEIISDVIPAIMNLNKNKKFNNELWQNIVTTTGIHKLSYKNKILKNSILEHVLKI